MLSMVVMAPGPNTKKQPPTDPVEVMANETALEVDFEPLAELDQAGVLRGLV